MIELSKRYIEKYKDLIFDTNFGREDIDRIGDFLKSSGAQKIIIAVYENLTATLVMIAAYENHICFIPVNPDWPIYRLNEIYSDHPDAVLINDDVVDKILCGTDDINIYNEQLPMCYSGSPIINIEFTELAYIIYTSGSTGHPKGVMISRDSLDNLIIAMKMLYGNYVTFASLSNPAFDFFIAESFLPALMGRTVFFFTRKELANLRLLIKKIKLNPPDVIQLVPSRLKQLRLLDVQLQCLKNVNLICVGGENISSNLLKEIRMTTSAKIYNLYGPTEGTVWSTYADLTHSEDVNIGYALPGVTVKVEPSNDSTTDEGELLISGKNVAIGYYGDQDLTDEKFALNKCGERYYRTGDYCRVEKDGSIRFITRLDRQIKVLGYRIELDEIEINIERYPNVYCAAVIEKNGNIVAYVSGKNLKCKGILEYMRRNLPSYLIPSEIVLVNQVILNSNGKKDYKIMSEIRSRKELTEDEQIWIIDICKKKISARIENLDQKWSDSFQVNSLAYIEMIVEIEDKFGFEFPDEVLNIKAINSINQVIDLVCLYRKS